MATGFMAWRKKVWAHFSERGRRRACGLFALALCALNAAAQNVTLVGLFPGKAVVVINGGQPRTISVGARQPEGVTLISTSGETATVDIDGKKHVLEMGQHFAAAASGPRMTILPADSNGHFATVGQINGKAIRFLVDTGATSVSIPAAMASAAGIDFRKGQRGTTLTANGPASVYRVVLDSVTVGEVTVYQVEGVVMEGAGLDVALLGMSFLNRVEMKREGQTLTLVKRF
jgi:aspartyl protease family protein